MCHMLADTDAELRDMADRIGMQQRWHQGDHFDIDRDMRNAKRAIGIVPQEIFFDPFFTPYEVLENQAGLYGVAKPLRRSLLGMP